MSVAAKNEHLYPFTLAFDEGLKQGLIDVETAGIFCDRIFEAYLEARIRANPALTKQVAYAQVHEGVGQDGYES